MRSRRHQYWSVLIHISWSFAHTHKTQDVGLLCGPSDIVYATDAKLKADISMLLGRITGPHVQVCQCTQGLLHRRLMVRRSMQVGKTTKPATYTSLREPRTMKPTVKKTDSENALKDTTSVNEEKSITPPKAKSSGKLDWSKAKPKVKAEESEAKIKLEELEKDSQETNKPTRKPPGIKAGSSTVNDFFTKKAPANAKSDPPAPVKKEPKPEKPQANIPSESSVKVKQSLLCRLRFSDMMVARCQAQDRTVC